MVIYLAMTYLQMTEHSLDSFDTGTFHTQLSMKFFQLINVKMPIIIGILTFMSGKNRIVDLSEPEKC